MLLIIHDPNQKLVIENIRLEHGHLPAVGDFHPVWYQDGLPQIEPALWFKTGVVTCVLLNVYHRMITWSTQPISVELLQHFRTCELDDIDVAMETLETTSKLDTETQDLDASFDEMFEAGEYLLKVQNELQNREKRKRKISIPDDNTINKIIVKLLHCYLLPCLKIKPSEKPVVEAAFSYQEALITKIDSDLEQVMINVSRTKNALQVKRKTMVEQFQDFSAVQAYPRDILLLLESQFQEDIKNLNEDLGRIQDEVNDLKEKNGDPELLKNKRDERDKIVGHQVKFIMARENIVNALALERPKIKCGDFRACYVREEGDFVVCEIGKYDMQTALGMYVKVHDVLIAEREERSLMITKKNLMISVREALRETLIALNNGEVTTGSSSNKTRSRRATDVLNASVPDQWLTLTEKVYECLTAKSEHRNRYLMFVQQIGDKLQASISVAKLAYRENTDTALRLQRRRRSHYLVRREVQSAIMASNKEFREVKHEVATLLRTRAESSKSFRHRMDSIMQMSESVEEQQDKNDENEIIQEQIKNELRLIQAQIHAHFDLMSSELQIALKEESEVAYFKIWLCYEVHFYEEIMHNLVKLYHLSYKLVCSNLKHNALYVTFHELAVQEKWLSDLLFSDKKDHVILDSESDEFVSEVDPHTENLFRQKTGSAIRKDSYDADEGSSGQFEKSSSSSEKGTFGQSGEEMIPIMTLPSYHMERTQHDRSMDTTSSSSESDLDNLNALVKRLSVYEVSSSRRTSHESQTKLSPPQTSSLVDIDESQSDAKETDLSLAKSEPTKTKDTDLSLASGNATNQRDSLEKSLDSIDEEPNRHPPLRRLNATYTSSSSVNSDQPIPKPRTKYRTKKAAPKPKPPAYRSEAFKQVFAIPIRTVYAILEEETPLNKLQLMTKCVRQIQKAVTKLHDSMRQKVLGDANSGLEIVDDEESLMCCDDFLTILTLILLHLDAKSLSDLYPHVVMLTDMMAPFLSNGLHSNSLTHFYGAYQIIFSTMVIKHSIAANMI